MLCRMELGHGGSVSLDAWAAVARVLDVEIAADIREPHTSYRGQIELRCHGLVTRLAQQGGWIATTEIVRTDRWHAPSSVETVLVRAHPKEAALVHAWHPALDVNLALGALEAGCDRLRRGHGPGWMVSGLVICPSTTENRRRVNGQVPDLAPVLPATASGWMAALRYTRSSMPLAGLLWTDRWATRFRPAPKRPGWVRET